MNDYSLRCVECGKIFDDSESGFLLECDEGHGPSLLQADYTVLDFNLDIEYDGIYRFREWLPIRRCLDHSPRTVIIESEELSSSLGLSDLHFAFNGYWPEKEANMLTCSFKELEAAAVLARIPDSEQRTMVISSAGNTGRAFLEYGSRTNTRMLVVVPECALPCMWGSIPKGDCCKLVALEDADYFDAIELGNQIAALPQFFAEGGAKNVARRDGMGTVMLSAAAALERIPDHYFQAVGSGTGAIAAWEMAWRLTADGRYGQRIPRLHLSQNIPFTIMSDAWGNQQRDLPDMPLEEARSKAKAVYATVLSNRKPPYSLSGGLFDALSDSYGIMYNITEEEARTAGQRFTDAEGIDLDPAAEVALASLFKAVDAKIIAPDNCILVNLTGGGAKRFAAENRQIPFSPDLTFRKDEVNPQSIQAKIASIL
jgi:cysteate synthase